MPNNDDDNILSWMQEIVDSNTHINFVNRIQNPFVFPTLDLGNNSYGTHLMASGEVDGRPIVYPHIIQDLDSGELRQLDDKAAREHALQNGEYLEFADPEWADYFARNYKKLWGQNHERTEFVTKE